MCCKTLRLLYFYCAANAKYLLTLARDGPGLKMLTWTLIFCSWQQFVRSKRQRAMQTRGSNQIKWASQKVAHTFLVLFALGCILISLWCLHRELTITIFTSFQQTKGHLFIGPKKTRSIKIAMIIQYSIQNFLEKIWTQIDLYVCNKCVLCHKRSKRTLKILQSNTLNGKYSYSWLLWSHKNLSYYAGNF